MTGLSWEDFCSCPDPFASSPPAFEPSCPAHGVECRDVSLRLDRWRGDLIDATPLPGHVVYLRLRSALEALDALLGDHWRHEAPGPTPSPTGSCGTCGGTGEVFHGFGENGPVFGGECGCETPFCGGCCEPWPCGPVKTIGGAVGSAWATEETR